MYKIFDDNVSGFNSYCDEREEINCLWEGCPHLNDLNWTRIELPDDAAHKTRADVLVEEAENMVKALREAHDYVQRYLAEDRPDFVEKWGAILARIDEVKG